MTELKLKSTYITQTSSARLYGLSIPIIGLTGGIATGKSSVSKILHSKGYPIIDADLLVHQIYADSKTILFIHNIAPACLKENAIDFKALRSLFFTDKKIQKSIEDYIYKELPSAFIKALAKFNKPTFIIYDVPLLFEKNLEVALDYTVTVYCPEKVQIERLIHRDSIDENLAKTIINKQLPIDMKKEKADYVIDNSGEFTELHKLVQIFTEKLFT